MENFILFVQPLSPFERVNIFYYFCEPPFFINPKNVIWIHFFLAPPTTFSFGKDGPSNFLPSSTSYFLASPKTPHNLTRVFTKMEIIHVCVGPFNLRIVHYPFWICIISYSHYLCSDKLSTSFLIPTYCEKAHVTYNLIMAKVIHVKIIKWQWNIKIHDATHIMKLSCILLKIS